MKQYPLMFMFSDFVAGNGFIARIVAEGRVLVAEGTEEGEESWFYGVNPGAIAGGGLNRADAYHDFRNGYLSVLYDIAAEAGGFEDFKREVESFFHATNGPTNEDWEAARTLVREGTLRADWVPVVDASTRPLGITVELMDAELTKPIVNALDQIFRAA